MIKRLLAATGILTIAFTLLVPVGARAQGGQGLEISPPLIELKTDPGKTVTTTIRVRNVTQDTLVTKSQTNDFVANGEDGKPKLLLEEDEKSPYSIKDWIVSIPTVTLKKGEQKPIKVTLRVPDNASPGGHFGVIRFTGTPPELEDTGVSLSASVGTLMLVNVSGNTSESAEISELYTAQNGKQRSLFEYGPVTIVERIKNTGNVFFKPSGTIRVNNMFGREVQTFSVNENGGNVLPGSTRKFEQELSNKLLFGKYTVQADIVYGEKNSIITESTSFWVIPYKLIAIFLGAILLIVFFIKRYNKYIVNKAQGKSGRKRDGKKGNQA
ncbi:DUF916 domain-containing protein [Candidatus Saccharibacteria bacterium]|nr:DUF916 domain-containing protein [Candidatus Saccharibacteria bacterium]